MSTTLEPFARALVVTGLLVGGGSCFQTGALWDRDGVAADGGQCRLSLCMAGAGELSSYGNTLLRRRCGELPGLVRDCHGFLCDATFSSPSKAQAALEELRSHEGAGCLVGVVAHSWGGVHALQMAHVSEIDRLVVVDAFAPLRPSPFPRPPRAGEVWSYRQRNLGAPDCSPEGTPFAPYEGIPLDCGDDDARCHDVDTTAHYGQSLGHCNIVEHLWDVIAANLVDGTSPPLPDLFPDLDAGPE